MHRCNIIILDVGTQCFEKLAGMFLNTFHRETHRKNRSKHFRWSLIVSIIQTSKLYMDLFFKTMCLTPEIMINPKLYHLPSFSPCKYMCDKV